MRPHAPTSAIARGMLSAALVAALLPGGAVPVAHAAGQPVTSAYGAPETAATWTGLVVVGIAPGSVGAAERALEGAGGIVVRRSGAGSFVVAQPPAGVGPDAFARIAGELDGVLYAEPESVVRASLVPDDPDYPLQWNLERIGAPDAWDVTRGSGDIRIAVVDTGVDLDHPELAGRLDTDADYDFVDRDTSADDALGHGTHVAGVIAAATDNGRGVAGIADGCTILPVRVLDRAGGGTASLTAEGIRYAADQDADVINLSLGDSVDSRVLSDAIDYAASKGCVIVAAAGNRGTKVLDYPAAYPDVISVGAVTSADARASYSAYSEQLDVVAPGGAAVGDRVFSLWPASKIPTGTNYMYGTSMAAPHVSAVAALLCSLNPTWTAGHVTRRILETAEDLGPVGKDISYGYGLLRADLALGADGEGPETPSDDEFPGIPLSTESVDGIVDVETDPVDVHSVGLVAGQRFQVWIRGSADATISLTLFDPTGDSMTQSAPLGSVVTTGTSVTLIYDVPEGGDGRYRLSVVAEEGGGEYSLAWRKGHPTFLSATAPKTSAWGGAATVSGLVTDADEGRMPGVRLVLDARPLGAPGWTLDIARTVSDKSGRYRLTAQPARPTDYRVRFEGAPGQLAATSAPVRVTPRASVGPPMPTGSVRRGTAFAVSGILRPRYAEDERVVRVTLWERVSGKWVARRSVLADNRDRDATSSRYVARLTIPSAGTWKMTASVPKSERHAATTSAAVLLSVP